MAQSIFTRPLDLVFVLFFLSHIPITILVDSQSVIPREYYPEWARQALDWHIAKHNDHLCRTNPLWFVSFVTGEILFQLPLFLPLAIGIIKQSPSVRIPAVIYGTHTATTLIPILTDFLLNKDVSTTPNYVAAALYSPYFIIPVLLVFRFWLGSWPSATAPAKARKAKAS